MPHLLGGGTTGSGKTMFIYTMLLSFLLRHPEVADLDLIISTAKGEDFTYFANLPHLQGRGIITDPTAAVALISSLVAKEFEERGRRLQEVGCRDIGEYNRKAAVPLHPIVVVVDEVADLADQFTNDRDRAQFYRQLRRIAQLGRSRGVHLVLFTQRPSAELLPTSIRSIVNARIALRLNDARSSHMILEEEGAESLQMHGDLLYKEGGRVLRAQGYYVGSDELAAILSGLGLQKGVLSTSQVTALFSLS